MKLLEVAGVDHNEIIEAINRDCQPYLKKIGGWKRIVKNGSDFALHRGMRSREPFLKKTVRNDRRPADTPLEVHQYVDQWFKEKVGHPYRSNAVFATGNQYHAADFGAPYVILPIGEFKACYSPVITDLTVALSDAKKDWFFFIKEKKTNFKVVDKVLERGKYTTEATMDMMIGSQHEVMIACDSYYALSGETYDAVLDVAEQLVVKGELK